MGTEEVHKLVMVVDDDSMNILVFKSILNEMGVQCDTAINGKQALAKIEARKKSGAPFYLVMFIDYSMPDLTGPEVAIEIGRSLKDTMIDMPFMACCTAYTDSSFRDAALNAGMKKFMTKPVDNN